PRWADQHAFVGRWLEDLASAEPLRDGLRRAFAGEAIADPVSSQMRADLDRDRDRLAKTLAGNARSAIDPDKAYPSTVAFARDEADHAAEAALRFVDKLGVAGTLADAGAAVERAQRWIQRLRWELADAQSPAEAPIEFSAAAVACLGAPDPLAALRSVAELTAMQLMALRMTLQNAPAS
ncbi:MAG: hypothetical protein AAGA54_37175, partial [Myxococcota bacterium]